jgi:hypothetical protein
MKLASLAEFASTMFHVVLANRLVYSNWEQRLGRINWGLDTSATLNIWGMIEFTRSTILASPCPQVISTILSRFR